jgi:hypothetical protein
MQPRLVNGCLAQATEIGVPITLASSQLSIWTDYSTAPPCARSAGKPAITSQLQPDDVVSNGCWVSALAYLRHSAQLRTPSLFWRRREPDADDDSEVTAIELVLDIGVSEQIEV